MAAPALRLPAIQLAVGACASTGLAFAPCRAQPAPLRVASTVERRPVVTEDTPIELRLSRALSPAEGELVFVVGGTDVTAVSERTGSRIVYRPTAVPLPAGETQVVVYARKGGAWNELRRFTVHVLHTAAGSHFNSEQSATVGNNGQLAEGRSAAVPAPDRRTFQDFALNAGLHASQRWEQWALTTQSNYVGVSRRQQALEFATRGDRAPMIDLSDYQVGVQGPGVSLALGHMTFGASRHLVNGFTARGTSLSLTRGATTLSVAALNGSAQLGWNDLVGLDRPTNRLFAASLGREIVPSHPGVVRFDATVLGGSKLPLTSFTQGAVVDAERSQGGAVQMSAALPNQRLRLVGGYTRSRFDNPVNDPQLVADTLTKRPRPVTSGARFIEANAAVFQNVPIPILGPAALNVAARDERVDPLFRSIGAFATADTYTGTGRLIGRWEIVLPGEDLPAVRDLLTEASLPIDQRGTQRRFAQLERFNIFLPPDGRVTLPGPDPRRLPSAVEGTYRVLLRIEATDDREADSDLGAAGAGVGIVHSGAVAGFPMPMLRYLVAGEGARTDYDATTSGVRLIVPRDRDTLDASASFNVMWIPGGGGETNQRSTASSFRMIEAPRC